MEKRRVEWVDTAKAVAILLVVLFHAVIFLEDVGLAGKWPTAVRALDTFRMPLFFFTAGLFAIGWQKKTFTELFRSRILLFLYLYLLWSVVRFVFFSFVPWVLDSGSADSLTALLAIFVWPQGGLWFIYALALFFAALWFCRGLPAFVPVVITGVVAVLFGSGILATGNDGWDKMGLNAVFFFAAAYGSQWVRKTAERLTWGHVSGAAVAYLACLGFVTVLGLQTVLGVRLLLSVVAVCFGVSLAVCLTKLPWMAWLRKVGAQTLPIYLIHYFPVAVIAALLVGVEGLPPALVLLLPLATSAVAVVASLALNVPLRRVPGVLSLPGNRQGSTSDKASTARAG